MRPLALPVPQPRSSPGTRGAERSPFPAPTTEREHNDRLVGTLARNQVIFHEVNERLREIAGLAADLTLFVCECGDPCCSEGIELDTIEYAAVRSMPNVFMIVPGHERLEVDRVIDDSDRVMLVEKTVLVDDADLKAALGSRPWPAHGL